MRKRLVQVLGFFACATASGWASAPERVVVYVSARANDTISRGDNQAAIDRDARMLQKQFPDSRVIVVDKTSNTEINRELSAVLSGNVTVEAMFISSHGGKCSIGQPRISSEDGAFQVRVSDPMEVKAVFEPVFKKWSPGAVLAFGGCRMLDQKSNQDRLWDLAKTAQAFRLKNGYVYMNENDGTEFFKVLYCEGVAGKTTHPKVRAAQIAARLVPPIGLATALGVDIVNNKGFFLHVRSQGNYFDYALYPSRATAALQTCPILEDAQPILELKKQFSSGVDHLAEPVSTPPSRAGEAKPASHFRFSIE